MTSDEQKLIPFPLDGSESAGALPDVSPDTELNTVLRSWTAPVATGDLDARVLESYREWTETPPQRARVRRWIARGLLGVGIAAAIFAAIWTLADRQPLAAMELLEQSQRADATLVADPTATFHRVCAYEERRVSDGAVLQRRIESWRRGGTQVRARRVFDSAGQMVAGEWIESGGARRTYANAEIGGAAPLPSRQLPIGAAAFHNDQPWPTEPSADAFVALLPSGAVEELTTTVLGSDRLVVAYRSEDRDAVIEAAHVVLRMADYHAIEQSVRVRQDGDSQEFYVREVSFESIPAAAVSNSVFVPNTPESASRPMNPRVSREPSARLTDGELLAVEVDLLNRLDRAGALIGQQATVTRRTDGRLEVAALVDGDERKKELLEAVEGLSRPPVIDLSIRTFAEAASPTASRSNEGANVRDIVVSGQIAARDELLRFFVSNDSGTLNTPTLLDDAVRTFANEALSHSREAVLHAGTVRDVITRFSAAQLESMGNSTRDEWRRLVTSHLRDVERESAMLRQLLRPVFFASPPVSDAEPSAPPIDVGVAAERLFRSVLNHDEAVRAAFALSSRPNGEVEVSRIDFLRSLRAVEDLARAIANQL